MAKCPACDHGVRTPSFLSLEGWRRLTCPNCKARLELKARPVATWLLPMIISFSWLTRLGHNYAVFAEGMMVFGAITSILLIVVRPQVRLTRRPMPRAEIHLKINNS